MTKYFVVKNQHGQYINKQKEWVDGSEPKSLFRSTYKDEAINLVVELSAKDIHLRAIAMPCELNDKLQPIVEICTTMPAAVESLDDDNDKTASGEETSGDCFENAGTPSDQPVSASENNN